MKFLAHGKRGDVFLTTYRGKKAVIKQVRATSKALSTLEHESFWLQQVNQQQIGPKFYSFNDGLLCMDYIKGVPIGAYLKTHPFSKALAKEILDQCRVLDKMHVNKFEMHHPVKHIVIKPGKPSRKTVVMLDFERCRWTEKPKNVTQLTQFLLRHAPYQGKDVGGLLRQYKKRQDEKTYTCLLATLFE